MSVTNTITTLDGNTILLREHSNAGSGAMNTIASRSGWNAALPIVSKFDPSFLPLNSMEHRSFQYQKVPVFTVSFGGGGGGGSTRVEDGLAWPRGSNRFGA